jgi:hypothetical protein
MAVSSAQDGGAVERANRWGIVGLGLLVVAFWILIHPYRGITHDGTLYGLLALSHLHPGSLDHDNFVRYGIQNDFTVFTPLYATAVRYLGLEHAAAALTLLTHVAFFGCAFVLARRFGSARSALLGVGLLIVVPAYYGWGEVFAYTESFLTPRQPAETFALAGLIAALAHRQILAGGLMLCALLLHPIIAAAGIALWATLFLALPRPRLALAVIITATTLVVALSATLARGPFAHFDAHWLGILQTRLKYLFPSRWPIDDWGPTIIPLCTLLVGALCAESRGLRQLCLATVLTVTFGVLIAVIESDWLHVILAGQVQVWRWQWLSSVVAALFLPMIALDCWRAEGLTRSTIILLIAAWLDTSNMFGILAALGACGLATAAPRVNEPRIAQMILVGSFLLLAGSLATVFVSIHDSLHQMMSVHGGSLYGRLLQAAHVLSYNGVLPALLLGLAWWLPEVGTSWSLLTAALGAAACAALAPHAVERWTQVAYPPQQIAAFAPWRTAVPPGTSVLWPEDPPLYNWFVLERPAYWSLYQMAGMVFSRDATTVGTGLESRVSPLLPSIRAGSDSVPEEGRTLQALQEICRLPGIAFAASWNNLGPTPYPPVSPDGRPQHLMYLYHCDPAHSRHAADTQ